MGRVVTVQRSASGVSTWTVDRDSILTGFSCTTSGSLMYDSSQTITNIITPAVTAIVATVIAFVPSGVVTRVIPRVPVFTGETILVSISAAGTAAINMEDAV
jgi:intracellular septation protein A